MTLADLLNDFAAAAAKLDGFLHVVQGNPVTVVLEKAVPEIVTIVNDAAAVDGFIETAAAVAPAVQGALVAVQTLQALGAKPADQAFFDRQEAERGQQES